MASRSAENDSRPLPAHRSQAGRPKKRKLPMIATRSLVGPNETDLPGLNHLIFHLISHQSLISDSDTEDYVKDYVEDYDKSALLACPVNKSAAKRLVPTRCVGISVAFRGGRIPRSAVHPAS
jgi:hypothetical protein